MYCRRENGVSIAIGHAPHGEVHLAHNVVTMRMVEGLWNVDNFYFTSNHFYVTLNHF